MKIPGHSNYGLLIAAGLCIILANIALMAASLSFSSSYGIEFTHFYWDPAAVAKLPFVTGWFSIAGDLLWIISATQLLLVATLALDPPLRRSLLLLGVLTLALGLDDSFMLHDGLFNFFEVPAEIAFAVYGVMLVAWVSNWRPVLESPWLVVAAAIGLLGASVAVDEINDRLSFEPWYFVLAEDVLKLTGICFWALYCTTWAVTTLKRAEARWTRPAGARGQAERPAPARPLAEPPPTAVSGVPAGAPVFTVVQRHGKAGP